MAKPNVQVIGICRWSYPSSSGDFRLVPDDLADARAQLYAPHRMRHRLFLLNDVVLPALRAQTDKDFTVVLLMGETLPEPYRTEVLDLIAGVPQIKPVFAPEGQPQKDIVRRLMIEMRDPEAEAVAEFRLDDDDAIAVDFVEETRRVFEGIRPFYENNGLFGLDYTQGFVMRTTRRGCEFKPIKARWWTPGMAVFIRPHIEKSVLDFHHMQLWHSMHMLMHSARPMFVRGVHHNNDSSIDNVGKRSGRLGFDPGKTREFMRERFNIDVQRVYRMWRRNGADYIGTEAPADADS